MELGRLTPKKAKTRRLYSWLTQKSKRAPAKLREKFWNCQHISTRNREAPLSTRSRRTPLIDAATEPTSVVIDADKDAAGITRERPPVDAVKLAGEYGERALNSGDDVKSALPYDSDSDLTDVEDMPETTLEEELLEEVDWSS